MNYYDSQRANCGLLLVWVYMHFQHQLYIVSVMAVIHFCQTLKKMDV